MGILPFTLLANQDGCEPFVLSLCSREPGRDSVCTPIMSIVSYFVALALLTREDLPASLYNRIVHTFVSKEWRARTQTHNVPVEKIIETLAKFGIEESMLPVEMGGNVQNHQVDFLRNQRAAELQEIQ